MKIPKQLQALIEDGIIDQVMRQLKSGKEATVYVVRCGEEIRCAKVYKQSEQRSFRKAAEYTEGRKSRRSRDARATAKNSRRGRQVQEEQWKSTEVDALYLLKQAGVRVPQAHGMFDGVLLMDMVQDEEGLPAPRLGEVDFSVEEAQRWHALMIRQIMQMLHVGIIHGDLSEYNVLLAPDGPVIIDLPQAASASGNSNAKKMLLRDINNMRDCFARVATELAETHYGEEIWALFEAGKLQPDSPLSGRFEFDQSEADVDAVLDQIDEARWEHEVRQQGRLDADAVEE